MKRTPLENPIQLPEWFKISNYKDVKSLDARGWYSALLIRADIKMTFRYLSVATDKPDFNRGERALYLYVEFLQNPCLLDYAGRHLNAGPSYSSIRSMKMNELRKINKIYKDSEAFKHFEDFERQEEERFYDEDPQYPRPIIKKEYDFEINKGESILAFNRDQHYSYPELISANLDAPDKILIAAFEEWLKRKRKERPLEIAKSFYTPNELARWASHRPLAYIDLMLWVEASNQNPTQAQIAQVIFFDHQHIDMTSKLRKETTPIAQKLLNRRTIQLLAAQAVETS
jgi:hypothetical protein